MIQRRRGADVSSNLHFDKDELLAKDKAHSMHPWHEFGRGEHALLTDSEGIVVNRVPLIRRVEKNVYSAMGYSGHGINMTHLAGVIMADAVAGTFERLDVFDRIRHTRVPFGQWFGNQMLALGMLYYRMRDLL